MTLVLVFGPPGNCGEHFKFRVLISEVLLVKWGLPEIRARIG